jgi:hypothetical protein
MANLNGFNANEVEPATDFDPIPAGTYLATITGSEVKPTKDATGEYLELTFQVLEGDYKNRLLWARLSLTHPKDIVSRIARSQLADICKAVGVLKPNDSAELHNLPLLIDVRLTKRKDTGELANEIKKYTSRKRSATQNTSSPQNGGIPPWRRPA